jgi:hypothetical protein
MHMTATETTPELSASEVRTLALASIGAALEMYDFTIFVFFANVIGKLFFAASLPDWVRRAQIFGIFATGYLVRPIGGIVIAHFGDVRGRKRMFILSVLLMAVPNSSYGTSPDLSINRSGCTGAPPCDAGHAGCSDRWRSARHLDFPCRACTRRKGGVRHWLTQQRPKLRHSPRLTDGGMSQPSVQLGPGSSGRVENPISHPWHLRIHCNVATPLAERNSSP